MYRVVIDESNISNDKYSNCLGSVFLLTGRGQSAEDILTKYHSFSILNEFALISIQPIDEWYPMPQGVDHQIEAVTGLKQSVSRLEDFIEKIEENLKIDRSTITLVGFSAGAVMAIQVAAQTKRPFKCVVSHNGAILEPKELPHSTHSTKYLTIHNKDDDCFSWEERYLPMKQALLNKNYDLKSLENDVGGHCLLSKDIEKVSLWIKKQFD